MHYMSINGKSRNDLVRDLGFKYTTIRDWEKGLTVPRMDKIEMLARYFNCENSDLLEDKKEKPTVNHGELTEGQLKLAALADGLSDDQIEMMIRVAKTILGRD